MKNPPAFQLYAQDFLADANVSIMNAHELGVYCKLLFHCWVEDGLPNDEEDLKDLSKGGDTTLQPWSKTWPKVKRCFYEKDGKLRNKRLDTEREKQIQWRKKSSKGGKKAAKNKEDTKGGDTTLQPPLNHPATLHSSSSSSSSIIKKAKRLSFGRSRTKRPSAPPIKLILDEHPKRWENISEGDKKLWAETYPGVNVEQTLREMIAYWDAQPAAKRKINWKRTIVNRLKWIQDNGTGARGGNGRSEYRASQIGKTPSRVKTAEEEAAQKSIREREIARAALRRRLFDESKARLQAASSRGDKRAVEAITEEIDKQIQETIR